MKPLVIKILIGALGFGGGFAAGFFCHKKMNDIKFVEVTEEEFEAIEKANGIAAEEKKDIPAASEPAAPTPAQEMAEANALPTDPDELRNSLQGKTPYVDADTQQKQAYEKMWKTTKEYSSEENANGIPVWNDAKPKEEENAEDEAPGEEDFDEDFLEQLEQEAVEAGNAFVEPPHEIGLADFYNDRPEYDKVTIKYFEPDNTWLDENDEVIRDISTYIGTRDQNIFATESIDGDPDVKFFRNDRYSSDYEIIRHHRSWHEDTGE